MADIVINYSDDILQGTLELLRNSCLKELVSPWMRVSIKPNLVLASPASDGATTHAEVIEGLILYLKELGISYIEIIESSWIGDSTKRAFRVCGYGELSKKHNIPLVDLKDDKIVMIDGIEVCQKAVDTDFLINVPVLKAHCQTRLTCCLKNMKGCISDREKRRFHTLGLHRPIAQLNKAIKTHFCLIDGICGDLTFEEGGNPVTRNMLMGGSDPVLLDSYCAELIGYQIHEIEYIELAAKLGVGQVYDSETYILELGGDNKPQAVKADSGAVRKLAAHINENQACSACYSALIYALHRTRRLPRQKINIGQGFRGKSGNLGCGNCTSGCEKFVAGCPPKTTDIVEFLES